MLYLNNIQMEINQKYSLLVKFIIRNSPEQLCVFSNQILEWVQNIIEDNILNINDDDFFCNDFVGCNCSFHVWAKTYLNSKFYHFEKAKIFPRLRKKTKFFIALCFRYINVLHVSIPYSIGHQNAQKFIYKNRITSAARKVISKMLTKLHRTEKFEEFKRWVTISLNKHAFKRIYYIK